eukprot:scaffold9208_cov68-Phaeocystis_antarctica.AAC.2
MNPRSTPWLCDAKAGGRGAGAGRARLAAPRARRRPRVRRARVPAAGVCGARVDHDSCSKVKPYGLYPICTARAHRPSVARRASRVGKFVWAPYQIKPPNGASIAARAHLRCVGSKAVSLGWRCRRLLHRAFCIAPSASAPLAPPPPPPPPLPHSVLIGLLGEWPSGFLGALERTPHDAREPVVELEAREHRTEETARPVDLRCKCLGSGFGQQPDRLCRKQGGSLKAAFSAARACLRLPQASASHGHSAAWAALAPRPFGPCFQHSSRPRRGAASRAGRRRRRRRRRGPWSRRSRR